jgi:imidazolonepropionase-like amidohydrolase
LGKEETLGSVQPGRFADLVAVKGDPLQDIRVLENLTHVMKDGKLVR